MALFCSDLVRCSLAARSPQSELNDPTPGTPASELPTCAEEDAADREERVHAAEEDASEEDAGSDLALPRPDMTRGRGAGTATYRSRGSPAASADRFLPAIGHAPFTGRRLDGTGGCGTVSYFGRNE
jgi:hypothetical protein